MLRASTGMPAAALDIAGAAPPSCACSVLKLKRTGGCGGGGLEGASPWASPVVLLGAAGPRTLSATAVPRMVLSVAATPSERMPVAFAAASAGRASRTAIAGPAMPVSVFPVMRTAADDETPIPPPAASST